MSQEILLYLPVWFVAYLLSLTCHEAAHAFAGKLGGDRTAEDQATLDPTKHIAREPIGTILVPIISFFVNQGHYMIGWASAPYDPRWAQRHPRRAALMAAAGPLANFTLVAIAGIVMAARLESGAWSPAIADFGLDRLVVGAEGAPTAFTAFFSVLFSVNLILGTFNLIPLPPLDGNAVVPLFLSPRQKERWEALFEGPGAFLGLALAMVIHAKFVIQPIFGWALGLLYGVL
jgi:Zn-dependent protease